MRSVTVQDIQSIAVTCVSDFYNKQIPLSEGLAKQANLLELNTDQLQRAVEATNTLAYLKSVEVSPERTGEFPLADYHEIIKLAFVPENVQSAVEPELDLFSQIFANGGNGSWKIQKQAGVDLEKAAQVWDETLAEGYKETLMNWDEGSSETLMYKYAAINSQIIDQLEAHAPVLVDKLFKIASEINKDSQAVEKISAVATSPEDFTKLAYLVFGDEYKSKSQCDFVQGMFNDKALEKTASLLSTLRESEATAKELAERKGVLEKVAEMSKEAWVMPALAGLGKKIITSKGVGRATAAVQSVTAKHGGSLTSTIGSGIGSAAGAVVKAPVKAAAKVVGGVAGATRNIIQNAAAKTGPGKALGIPTRKVNPAAAAVGTTMALGALDATVWSPKPDNVLGTSGKVWDSLN